MNFRRMILINVLLLIILIGGGFLGYYFYNQSTNYLTTDNATISGQQVVLAATANGQLTDWSGVQGKKFSAGDQIGTIQTTVTTPQGAMQKVNVGVTAPTNLTVVQNNAVKNSFVAAGTPLAYGYDLDHLYVTANIKETDLNTVKEGNAVDVYVDAYPGNTLQGHVSQIGLATASTFSLLPSTNTSGNYTKVTQVIPVTISLDGYNGLAIVPGMNVTVRIHK